MWSKDKIRRLLGPSAIVGEIEAYQQHRRATYEEMAAMKPMKKFFSKESKQRKKREGGEREGGGGGGGGGGSIFTYDNCVWAQGILDSRSIWWDGVRR